MSGIDAVVTGNLTKDAEPKISSGGKNYTSLIIRIPGEPAQFVRALVFGDDAETLMSCRRGDSVSVAGTLTVGMWESNGKASPSLSLMGHRAISPTAKQKRKPPTRYASRPTPQQMQLACEAQTIRKVDNGAGLADDLPWEV